MMFDRPYFLTPQKNGEKGYFLLRDALENLSGVAIGKIVIRTKQHLCAVMVRGEYLICELLRFSARMLDIEEADYLKGTNRRAHTTLKNLRWRKNLLMA